MPYPQFDRQRVQFQPLSTRKNKLVIAHDHIAADAEPPALAGSSLGVIAEAAERIRAARRADKPVILAFGAHTIKNGLGPVLIALMEGGWLTHLATNGAGIIHDWEFAYLGQSGEDVRANVARGEFGIWQETGYYINLALIVGAYEGKGYGESLGSLISQQGLLIPSERELAATVTQELAAHHHERAAAAADLLGAIHHFTIEPGWLPVPHPHLKYSAQAAAYRLAVPFTGHPMFGHDIIYTHPLNHGAALGRCAQRDFLTFADGVSQLEGGVYLSLGSAVMSPMIFEKAHSMGQNLALQHGRAISGHYMLVVDLQQSTWNWREGEPPITHPDYYLRFHKTFNRMGGDLRYLSADNRAFLLALARDLRQGPPAHA